MKEESDIGVRLASVCRKATVDKTEGAAPLVETPHAQHDLDRVAGAVQRGCGPQGISQSHTVEAADTPVFVRKKTITAHPLFGAA